MPTGNFDSSLHTQRRRNYALYTWNRINQARVNAGTSILREQPSYQLGTVVTDRHQVSANQLATATDPCPCRQPVSDNAGGNNSQNWE
jgi:hypothetical protein